MERCLIRLRIRASYLGVLDNESCRPSCQDLDLSPSGFWQVLLRALDLLSSNGVIRIDNVRWSGEVLKQPPPDDRTAAIRELNPTVANDLRVAAVLVTVRDEVLVVRKKAGQGTNSP